MKSFGIGKVDINAGNIPKSRNLASEIDNSSPSSDNGIEEQSKNWNRFFDKMDAIAYGVETRYELITGFSTKVAKETIAIARELGVPEEVTEKWATLRLIRKVREIKYLLEKL